MSSTRLNGTVPLTRSGHDAKRYADLQNDMKLLLKVYDTILANQKYLVKKDMSAVDLFHLPPITALDEVSARVQHELTSVPRRRSRAEGAPERRQVVEDDG